MIKDAERQLVDIEKVNKSHEENALKRDKVIQGLASALHKREKEVCYGWNITADFFFFFLQNICFCAWWGRGALRHLKLAPSIYNLFIYN